MKIVDIIWITIRAIIVVATFIILIPLLFGHKERMMELKAIQVSQLKTIATLDSISAQMDKTTIQLNETLESMNK